MIRLACQGYDRGDYDGTTLEKALDDGWEASAKNKPTRDSCQEYKLGNTPPGKSIFDWFTQTTAELPS